MLHLAALSVTDAAKALNVTRQALSALLNGRSGVSADMALRLEAALGVEAGFWLRIQVAHDLWEARQRGWLGVFDTSQPKMVSQVFIVGHHLSGHTYVWQGGGYGALSSPGPFRRLSGPIGVMESPFKI
ncbi:MAG: HigA family addiction module antitoxin [Acidithiobacillus sp.]